MFHSVVLIHLCFPVFGIFSMHWSNCRFMSSFVVRSFFVPLLLVIFRFAFTSNGFALLICLQFGWSLVGVFENRLALFGDISKWRPSSDSEITHSLDTFHVPVFGDSVHIDRITFFGSFLRNCNVNFDAFVSNLAIIHFAWFMALRTAILDWYRSHFQTESPWFLFLLMVWLYSVSWRLFWIRIRLHPRSKYGTAACVPAWLGNWRAMQRKKYYLIIFKWRRWLFQKNILSHSSKCTFLCGHRASSSTGVTEQASPEQEDWSDALVNEGFMW